jgi:hypothetical protein
MARKKSPAGWPITAELEEAQKRGGRILDAMTAGHPAPLRHTLAGPFNRLSQYDPPVALQLGLAPDGRLVCTGLLVGWQLDAIGDATKVPLNERTALTARALRGIKLGEILNELEPLADGVEPFPDRAASPKRYRKFSTGAWPVPNWLHQTVPAVRPPHPGPKGYSDEHYKNVADLYKMALAVKPGAPMKYLTELLGLSPKNQATAYRWRNEAVARGFLPESEQPKTRRGPPDKPRRKRS